MPKFRKKPVVIEARQYTRIGLEAEKVAKWCHGEQSVDGLTIHTLEGEHFANYGDWIIKGVKGEFYPCKPDIFALTYEEYNEGEQTEQGRQHVFPPRRNEE